jgi:hypothetical protein
LWPFKDAKSKELIYKLYYNIEAHLKFNSMISLTAFDKVLTLICSLFTGNLGVYSLPKETGTLKQNGSMDQQGNGRR